ncbi:hypothetical protein PE36_07042 [Moritella sp. PE36]|nr:hypothetical protein PE36_07042 [Moritella sp. PE36]
MLILYPLLVNTLQSAIMIIPYKQLDNDTLNTLIEHFVLREGTDYGTLDMSMSEKVCQVIKQLECGDVVIVYSELHDSVNILPKSEVLKNPQ